MIGVNSVFEITSFISVFGKRGIHRQDAKSAKKVDKPAHNRLELVLRLIHCELPLELHKRG